MKKILSILAVIVVISLGSFVAVQGFDTTSYYMRLGDARWHATYNAFVDYVGEQFTALATLVNNWAIEDNIVTMVTATPTYASGTTFTLAGDYTSRFTAGKVVQAQVAAGMVYSTVASSSYAAPNTTVILNDSVLTTPITRVYVVATRDGLWPNGPGYVVAADYGSDQAALAAADAVAYAAGKRLVVGTQFSITSDLALSASLEVLPVSGGAFAIATTKVLTIINASYEAGDYQTFNCIGTGGLSFLNASYVKSYWFGAVDGSDNTAAVQKAMDSLPDNKGVTLHLCESLYTDHVTLNKSKVIVTSNNKTQTFDATYVQTDADAERLNYNILFTVLGGNVTFTDVVFSQGSYATATIPVWYNLGAANGIVKDCKFYNMKYSSGAPYGLCVQIRTTAHNCVIRDSYFYNCCAAVYSQGNRCSIIGNVSENDAANGGADCMFEVDGIGSKILNNKIYKTQDAGTGTCFQTTNSSDFEIAGNFLYGFKAGIAIHIYDYSGVGTGAVTKGLIHDNILDGAGLTHTAAWAMIKLLPYVSGVKINNNILRNPPTGGATVNFGIDAVLGNDIYDNDLDMGTEAQVYAAIALRPTVAGSEAMTHVTKNNMTTVNRGVFFYGVTNNAGKTIYLKHNIYKNMVAAIHNDSLIQNAPVVLENEDFESSSFTTYYVNLPKFLRPFGLGRTGKFPHKCGGNTASAFYSHEVPTSGNYNNTTWEAGDTIYNSAPAAADKQGWVCTTKGTFSAGYQNGSIGTGTNILTFASSAGFYVGDYINISGVTGTFKILTLVGNTATLDGNADATVVGVPVDTPPPVFKAMANLAA